MSHKTLFCAILLFCVSRTSPVSARDSIGVVNGTTEPLYVWFWNPTKKAWTYPPLCLPPRAIRTVYFDGEGRYYVVGRSQLRGPKKSVIGWVNFRKLLDRSETATFVIEGSFQTTQEERTYAIMKPVWQTRTRERVVYRRRYVDGGWYLIPETVIEEYRVYSEVPEQRTGIVDVVRLLLGLKARDGSQDLFSSLTLKTAKEGAFVRYQLYAGGQINISDNPTNSTQRIPAGSYFLWTERDGVETSSHYSYDIYEKERSITIQEDLSG